MDAIVGASGEASILMVVGDIKSREVDYTAQLCLKALTDILTEQNVLGHLEKHLQKLNKSRLANIGDNRYATDRYSTCATDCSRHIREKRQDDNDLEILQNASIAGIRSAIRNLIESAHTQKYLIYVGPYCVDSGTWLLEDGLFTFNCLSRAIMAFTPNNKMEFHLYVPGEWNWNALTEKLNISVHRINSLTASCSFEDDVVRLMYELIKPADKVEMLFSDEYGVVKFSSPTVYIFPAGSGSCTIFGVQGCTVMINGGYSTPPCFWDFVKHLDRIDAILVTHHEIDLVNGVSQLVNLKRADISKPPSIGSIVLQRTNMKATSTCTAPLQRSIGSEIKTMITNSEQLGIFVEDLSNTWLKPTSLYSKLGHGILHMYSLPAADAEKYPSAPAFKIPSDKCVCTLLIWKPCNPSEPDVRILFPANTNLKKVIGCIEYAVRIHTFLRVPPGASNPHHKPDACTRHSNETQEKTIPEVSGHLVSSNSYPLSHEDGNPHERRKNHSCDHNHANGENSELMVADIHDSGLSLLKSQSNTSAVGRLNKHLPSAGSIKVNQNNSNLKGHLHPGHPFNRSPLVLSAMKRMAFLDLVYVPRISVAFNMDPYFFELVRSQRYVISSKQSDEKVIATLDALLEGRMKWETFDCGVFNHNSESERYTCPVSIILSHQVECVHHWQTINSDILKSLILKIERPADTCGIQLGKANEKIKTFRCEFTTI